MHIFLTQALLHPECSIAWALWVSCWAPLTACSATETFPGNPSHPAAAPDGKSETRRPAPSTRASCPTWQQPTPAKRAG